MKMRILFFLFYIHISHLFATNYYISSSSGSDTNNGLTPATAWKTVLRAHNNMPNYLPGDSILFKRGDAFYDGVSNARQINIYSAGTSTNPIVFGAYGNGENPEFRGSVVYTSWQSCSTCGNPNIYETTITKAPTHLFVDGEMQIIARYPNKGNYLYVDALNSPDGSTGFTDAALNQPDDTWNGATVRFRTQRWQWHINTVSDFGAGNIVFGTTMTGKWKPQVNWGYFIDNKLNMLDTAGEWYYDAITKKLYVLLSDNQNPNTHTVEGAYYDYAFRCNFSAANIIIENITMKYHKEGSIWLENANNISIKNCKMIKSAKYGINMIYSKNNAITNNYFEETVDNAINSDHDTSIVIKNNYFTKIGQYAGYGKSGTQDALSSVFFKYGGYWTVVNNYSESSGYTAFQERYGRYHIFANNVAKSYCSVTDDGGGFYTFGGSYIQFRNNIVDSSVGAPNGLPEQLGPEARGIYLDENSNYCTVEYNTVNNVEIGIHCNRSRNHKIRYNNVFDCHEVALKLGDYSNPDTYALNNIELTNNIFYSMKPDAYSLFISTSYENTNSIATFSNNYFYHPYHRSAFRITDCPTFPTNTVTENKYYSYNQLNKKYSFLSNQNINSYFKSDYYQILNKSTTNKVKNGTYTSGTTDWVKTTDVDQMITTTNIAFTGNCLKIVNNQNNSFSVRSSDFNSGFTIGKYYITQISLAADQEDEFGVIIKRNSSGVWGSLFEMVETFPVSSIKTNYNYISEQLRTDMDKIYFANLATSTNFYIDDVQVYDVSVTKNSNVEIYQKILINETNTEQTTVLNSNYRDIAGSIYQNSVILQPFTSVILILDTLSAQKYYVSSSTGDDNNLGLTPETAWKTINKVNAKMSKFVPGDSIFFKRGDVFRGELKITQSGEIGNPIVFSNYGIGELPVINATTSLTSWTQYTTNIWVADCANCQSKINNLMINGVSQQIGRYPNADEPNNGYLFFETASGKTKITDNELTDSPNWAGATGVVRTNAWLLDNLTISIHSFNQLTFSDWATSNLTAKYGYFFQNHILTLDKNGEWYYNPTTKKVYLYYNSDPTSKTVEVPTNYYCLSIENKDNISILSIDFTGSNSNNVFVKQISNFVFNNNSVQNSGVNGVSILSCNYLEFNNNRILNTNNNAVDIFGNNVNMKNNYIFRTSVRAGMGKSGNEQYNALRIIGANNTIEKNVIDSTGYLALRFEGDDILVKNNVVSNFCITKNDGGGIYTWTDGTKRNKNRRVIGNIAINSEGGSIGTSSPDEKQTNGIYIDDRCTDIVIENNTVYNCGKTGIFIHNSDNIQVLNNNTYQNENEIRIIHDNLAPTFPIYSCNIQNNVFVSNGKENDVLYFYTIADDVTVAGLLNNNYYCRPLNEYLPIECRYVPSGAFSQEPYSLQAWVSKFGHDKNSKSTPIDYSPTYSITTYISTDLLDNKTFNSNISPWTSYANRGNCSPVWNTNSKLDNGSLKVQFATLSGFNDDYVLLNNTMPTTSVGYTYVVRFSMIADKPYKSVRLMLRRHATPYDQISETKIVLTDTVRREYEIFLVANKDAAVPRLDIQFFGADGTIWFDNMEMYRVEVSYKSIEDIVRFEYNSSGENKTVSLDKNYLDVRGNYYSGSVSLAPFSSLILFSIPNNYSSWLGNTSSWNIATNWSNNAVPIYSTNVVITPNPVGGNMPEITNTSVCKNLTMFPSTNLTINPTKALTVNGNLINNSGISAITVKSDNTGTGSLIHNTDDVSATVQLYLSGGKYHYISSPIKTSSVSIFSDITSKYFYNEKNFDSWDASGNMIGTSGWVKANSETLLATSGLALKVVNTKIYSFNGLLNNGIYTINMINTQSGYATKYDGWNLIGNPYPSPMDWDLITKSGIANSIYFYNGTNYTYYVGGGANEGAGIGANVDAGVNGRYIPVGQGFMVKCLNPTGYVSFANNARTHTTQSFYKSENADVIRLNILQNANSAKDETVVRFLNNATTEFDGDYDAYKMFGNSTTIPNLYSLTTLGDELAINSLNLMGFENPQGFNIQIGLSAQAGTYTISAPNITLINPNPVYLEDKVLNTFTDLKTDAYTFTHTGGDVRNRFRIVFNSNLQGFENHESDNDTKIWSFGKTIYVSGLTENSNLEVFDMLGRKLFTKKVEGYQNLDGMVEVETGLMHGIYFVKVHGKFQKVKIQ